MDNNPIEELNECMREYRDHGIPFFPILIRLNNGGYHLFTVWFN